MNKSTSSVVTPTKTIKAGCGIRYDPDDLGEDTGFDFSDAVKMKNKAPTTPTKTDNAHAPNNKEGNENG